MPFTASLMSSITPPLAFFLDDVVFFFAVVDFFAPPALEAVDLEDPLLAEEADLLLLAVEDFLAPEALPLFAVDDLVAVDFFAAEVLLAPLFAAVDDLEAVVFLAPEALEADPLLAEADLEAPALEAVDFFAVEDDALEAVVFLAVPVLLAVADLEAAGFLAADDVLFFAPAAVLLLPAEELFLLLPDFDDAALVCLVAMIVFIKIKNVYFLPMT